MKFYVITFIVGSGTIKRKIRARSEQEVRGMYWRGYVLQSYPDANLIKVEEVEK